MNIYERLSPDKKAYIFELDNVLYPEKDYLLQVYYLFATFLEFTETFPPAGELTSFFKTSFQHHGKENIFNRAQKFFSINEKYRVNFERLHSTAQLPLKLLLYNEMLKLLQNLVINRKQIFIVTNGNLQQQLNKLKQVEWNGLEGYLTVYFSEEIKPKPSPEILLFVMKQHHLELEDIQVIGNSKIDENFALACGVDYLNLS